MVCILLKFAHLPPCCRTGLEEAETDVDQCSICCKTKSSDGLTAVKNLKEATLGGHMSLFKIF